MPESFLDPSWYRVAGLSPRLRGHVKLHRHHYRGDVWYVLQDNTNGRYHRFSASAYAIIGHLSGHQTVQVIWDQACAEWGDDAPSQSETIRLLQQLIRRIL